MSIVSLPLPVQLTNGQVADGGQVMTDLNAIASNVNANAAASGVNGDITQLTALTSVTSNVTFNGGLTMNNAALGSPTITGGTISSSTTGVTLPVGTNTTQLATMAALINQAFSSGLPAISAGVADYVTTNDGSIGYWTNLLKSGTIRFADSTDTTKRVAFNASGITTGNTRTLTVPDKSFTLASLDTNTFTAAQTLTTAAAINEALTTVASATSPDIWTNTSNVINYTGTTTATGFAAAPQAGSRRTLVCAGAAVFTAGANMLIDGITSGSNYVASANDRIYVTALSTTQFLLEPRKANGTSVIAVPRGYMNGFTLSNDGTLPNTVLDIAAGSAIDSTNATTITGTAFTKSTAGVWAAGSGANGMGQGLTIANSTWYHVFAIINNGAFDVYFDTSISAANKPANTTAYRRIGSFKTNGSAQIIPFTQYGQLILWATQVVELNGAAPASATLLAITVPPDLNMRPLLSAIVQANAAPAGRFYEVWSPVLGSGDREQFSLYEQAASANISGNCNTVVTNTSRQVYHRNPGAALGNVILYTQGWIDQSIASVS